MYLIHWSDVRHEALTISYNQAPCELEANGTSMRDERIIEFARYYYSFFFIALAFETGQANLHCTHYC